MSSYEPPKNDADLLLAWLRRARESQFAHYAFADRLAWKGQTLGVPVILLTTLVGATALSSVAAAVVPTFAKVIVGALSLLAAVLSALQTFFKYAERAERHRVFGARYGALRRELEQLHSNGGKTNDKLRQALDKLAEDAPAVPEGVFRSVEGLAERD